MQTELLQLQEKNKYIELQMKLLELEQKLKQN